MRRKRPALVALALSGVTVLLAACGSQVDHQTFLTANGVNAGPAGTNGDGTGSLDPSGGATGTVGDPTAGDPGVAGPADDPGPGGSSTGGPGVGGPGGGPGGKVGSCNGFDNQTGITDDKIVIANASDISGPVPGLFEASRLATEAYVAFFNASQPNGICGRKLEVLNLDSREDAGGDQQAYAKACEESFAAVGSMSSYDMGGAATAENCGLPDIRATSVNPERSQCATCFATQPVTQNHVQRATALYYKSKYPEASQHAAFLWVNQGAAAINAKNWVAAWRKLGYKVDYTEAIDVSEFNYTPYVQQMKDQGIRYVHYLGPYQYTVRLAKAMEQQGFKPDVFTQDPTAYDPGFVSQGGTAVNNFLVYLNIPPFEKAAANPEMSLYLRWLRQIDPDAEPNFYGVFSWSATRLFVEQALALGGRLNRETLIDSVRQVKTWTGNGIHSVQHPGTGETGECWLVVRLVNGTWREESGGNFMCKGLIDSGVK